MSTAFFHGFDEEFNGGLDLPSDVFDQLFADHVGSRVRGCAGENSRDCDLASSAIDELTGSSIGDIDSHALLADSIGVDIVGRSSGAPDVERAVGPSPTYIQSPLGDGMLRTHCASSGSSPMLNHSGLVSKSLDPYLGLVSDGLVGFPCQPLSSAPHFRDFSASSSLPPAFQSDSSRSFCTSSTSQPACSTGSEYHHLMSHHHLLPSTSTAIPMEISTTTSMALSSHAPLPPTSSIGEQFLSSLVSGPGPIVSRHSVACGPTGQAPSQLSFNSTVHSSLTGLQSTSPLKPLAPTASSLSGGSVAAPMSTTPMKTILSLQGSTKPKRKRVRTRSRPTKTSNAEASQDPSKDTGAKGGWPKGKPRARKHLGEPRPVASSWQLFISDQFKHTDQSKDPNLLTKNMKGLSAKWSMLDAEEKRVFEDRAAEDRRRYMQELEEFQNSSQYSQMLEDRVKEHFGSAHDQVPLPVDVVETLKDTNEVQNSKDLCCTLCQQTFTTQHNHQEHLVGKKHLQNVRKNAKSRSQAASQWLPVQDDVLLTSKVEHFMEGFYADSQVRDLELQELNTRQMVSRIKTKKYEDVIGGLETRKSLLSQRSQLLDNRNRCIQEQLHSLQSLIGAFATWQPSRTNGNITLHCSTGDSPPLASQGAGYPCSPATPVTSMRDVLLQKSLSSFPSPPSSGPSSCSTTASGGGLEIPLGVCKSTGILPSSVCSCQSHCDRCWIDMPTDSDSHSTTTTDVMSLDSTIQTADLCSVTSTPASALTNSIFSLAHGMDSAIALPGDKVDSLLLSGSTSTSSMSGVLLWNDWLTST